MSSLYLFTVTATSEVSEAEQMAKACEVISRTLVTTWSLLLFVKAQGREILSCRSLIEKAEFMRQKSRN